MASMTVTEATRPEKRDVVMGVRVEARLHDQVVAAAARDARTVSAWVRLMIVEALRREEA